MTPPRPTKLALQGDDRLSIEWSDGEQRTYTIRELRDRCPCATCREKRLQPAAPANLLPVLSAAETQPLRIAGIKPVGNYAYAIDFSDGHDTGIYTLEFLPSWERQCRAEACYFFSPLSKECGSNPAGLAGPAALSAFLSFSGSLVLMTSAWLR